MTITVGDAILWLGTDDSKLDKGLRQAEGKAKGFIANVGMGIAQGVGQFVAGGVVNIAKKGLDVIVDVGKQAVSSAADAEEMLSKMANTFGGSTATLSSELEDFANRTGRSRYELKGMATDLGAVLKALGFTEEGAADLSNTTTQLAVDLGSFNNLEAADVAERLTKAYTGEFESLKALGIVINQTMLKRELETMGIQDNINEVDQVTKALAIQNIIMRQTTDAQGDAERTSDSFTNQMVAFKAQIKDTVTEIGTKLLPVLTPMLQKFNQMAQEILPKVVNFIETRLVPFFEKIGTTIQDLLSGDFDFMSLIPPGLQPIVEALRGAFDRLSAWWDEHGPGIMAAGQQIFGTLRDMLSDLAARVVPWIVEKIGQFSDWMDENGPLIEQTIQTIADFWENTLAPAIVAAWDVIKPILDTLFSNIGDLGVLVMQVINGDWQGAWTTAQQILDNTLSGFGLALENFANWVTTTFLGTTWDEVEAQWRLNWDMLNIILDTVFNNIKGAIQRAVDWIKEKIGGLGDGFESIKDKLPWWLQPGSPTPLEEGTVGIMERMDTLANQTIPALKAALNDLAQSSAQNFTGQGAQGSSAGGRVPPPGHLITEDGSIVPFKYYGLSQEEGERRRQQQIEAGGNLSNAEASKVININAPINTPMDLNVLANVLSQAVD